MPRIVDKETKKMEILHAAMKIFARNGIVKTKMIDVATEAGVGKGTIYEYFRSKEEIFTTAFVMIFENLEVRIMDVLAREEDPVVQLNLLVETTIKEFMHGEGEFAEIMMDFWAEGVRNKDKNVLAVIDLKKIYSKYRSLLKVIIKNGIDKGVFKKMDTNSLSAVLIAALDGIYLQWILDRKAINISKVSKVLLESFIDGIRFRKSNDE
jgi:TetR/AcrR family fatty acid metabolism transcriptional regulator